MIITTTIMARARRVITSMAPTTMPPPMGSACIHRMTTGRSTMVAQEPNQASTSLSPARTSTCRAILRPPGQPLLARVHPASPIPGSSSFARLFPSAHLLPFPEGPPRAPFPAVRRSAGGFPLSCLARTRSGQPPHPNRGEDRAAEIPCLTMNTAFSRRPVSPLPAPTLSTAAALILPTGCGDTPRTTTTPHDDDHTHRGL